MTDRRSQKAYEEMVKAQREEWEAKIKLLQAKINKADAKARIDQQMIISKLEEKWEVFQDKIRQLRDSNEKAMVELRNGVDQALQDLEESYEKAKSEFN